ncbi:MAG: hypothetical protein WA667_02605 [Candidatus Nitrosopolaris sp.]
MIAVGNRGQKNQIQGTEILNDNWRKIFERANEQKYRRNRQSLVQAMVPAMFQKP